MKFYSILLALFCLTIYIRTQPCSFTIGTTAFNICPLAGFYTLDTYIEGQLSFAIANNNVPNCANNLNIWAAITHDATSCDDVATLAPTYALQDPAYPITGGLLITHPVQKVTPSSKGFQLIVKLNCMIQQTDVTSNIFKISEIFAAQALNQVTYTITGQSALACGPIPTGCIADRILIKDTPQWYANYNLCPLNHTVFNIPDKLGGYLALNLGGVPMLQSCMPIMNDVVVYGNYYPKVGNCFPAASHELPTYITLTKNPTSGLLIKWMTPASGMYFLPVWVELTLICDPAQTDVTQINPTMDTAVTNNQYGFTSVLTLKLTGKSSSACPVP